MTHYNANYALGHQHDWNSATVPEVVGALTRLQPFHLDYAEVIQTAEEFMVSYPENFFEELRLRRLDRQIIISGTAAEIERLKGRKDLAQSELEELDERVKELMEKKNVRQYKTPLMTFSVRKNPPSLITKIEPGSNEDYDRFVIQKKEWDKKLIKETMLLGSFVPHQDEFEIVTKTRLEVK